jgi:hypothetical protein
MALLIDSSTGVTLASRGNSTSPKFRGLEVLSPQDSLRSSTHKGSRRVTHTTLRNSASMELQGKKCCLYKTPYVAAPIRVPRWRHHEFYSLRVTSYRCTYKSQNPFFWFTSDAFRKRLVLSYQDSYVNFYKGVYEQRWCWKRTTYHVSGGVTQRVPQASLQADSALTRCHEQKPQEPWRTRWPQEKGRWAISLDSRASHPTHSYAVGYYSWSKYNIPRDWLREACHMARVRWGTHCKEFCSEEGLHYWMEQSARNQLEHDQVQRALEKSSGSCR